MASSICFRYFVVLLLLITQGTKSTGAGLLKTPQRSLHLNSSTLVQPPEWMTEPLFHSPVPFVNDFAEMKANLKIFIYPRYPEKFQRQFADTGNGLDFLTAIMRARPTSSAICTSRSSAQMTQRKHTFLDSPFPSLMHDCRLDLERYLNLCGSIWKRRSKGSGDTGIGQEEQIISMELAMILE